MNVYNESYSDFKSAVNKAIDLLNQASGYERSNQHMLINILDKDRFLQEAVYVHGNGSANIKSLPSDLFYEYFATNYMINDNGSYIIQFVVENVRLDRCDVIEIEPMDVHKFMDFISYVGLGYGDYGSEAINNFYKKHHHY